MPYIAEAAEILNYLQRKQNVELTSLEQLWIWIKINSKLKIIISIFVVSFLFLVFSEVQAQNDPWRVRIITVVWLLLSELIWVLLSLIENYTNIR